jgi:ketosteroid isomerase-like protein
MNKNVAVINSIYEAFGKGDVPTILNYLSENVEWEKWDDNFAQRAGVPWLMERKGKTGALEFFKIIGEFVFKDFQVVSIMANENHVAVECILEVDIPSTGGHFKEDEIHLWSFDGQGQVIRFRHFADTAKHIEAAKVTMAVNI